MKSIQFLFLSIVIASIVSSCNNSGNEAAMKKAAADTLNYTTIKWEDSLINFGTVALGETVNVKFVCTNTGSKPLVITNAKPGCGCTVANFTREPIAPGAKGEVFAALDTKKTHGGEVRKTIIVTTNTSNGVEHFLYFSGNITGGENDKVMVPHEAPKTKK